MNNNNRLTNIEEEKEYNSPRSLTQSHKGESGHASISKAESGALRSRSLNQCLNPSLVKKEIGRTAKNKTKEHTESS